MCAFIETDPATWGTLPDGYHWEIVDESTGEEHLFSPDMRDVSAALYDQES